MIKTSDLDEAEKQALDHLYEVIDPEIGLNIVDLGLVYALSINDEAKTIHVRMTLTTQFCPMGDSILKSVEETLVDCFPDYKVEVELVFEPRWDAGMISEEGQAFLG
jgi:metal-sulfur cluster biosynthetic enzyme